MNNSACNKLELSYYLIEIIELYGGGRKNEKVAYK